MEVDVVEEVVETEEEEMEGSMKVNHDYILLSQCEERNRFRIEQSGEYSDYSKGQTVFTSENPKERYFIGDDIFDLVSDVEVYAVENGDKIEAGLFSVIVKITEQDRQNRLVTEEGFSNPNFYDMQNYTQVGLAVSVGSKISFIEKGDRIIFQHQIQDTPDRLIKQDINGNEYWCVRSVNKNYNDIIGIIRNETIIPLNGRLVCKGERVKITEIEENNLTAIAYDETYTFYKARVLNADEKSNYKKGDIIICSPASNYEVIIDKKPYWFIEEEYILATDESNVQIKMKQKRNIKEVGTITDYIYLPLNTQISC